MLFFHIRKGCLHIVKRTDNTTLPGFKHIVIRSFFNRSRWNNGLGVVNNNINSTIFFNGSLNNFIYTFSVCRVASHSKTFPTSFFNLCDCLVNRIWAAACCYNLNTSFSKAKGNSFSDALASSRNDSNFFI